MPVCHAVLPRTASLRQLDCCRCLVMITMMALGLLLPAAFCLILGSRCELLFLTVAVAMPFRFLVDNFFVSVLFFSPSFCCWLCVLCWVFARLLFRHVCISFHLISYGGGSAPMFVLLTGSQPVVISFVQQRALSHVRPAIPASPGSNPQPTTTAAWHNR